ncbi:MAG: hypothetical protein KDA89_04730 [Planctomycetaceae bacterium]|nr:hypothetical protein [Planctomycetaceae bacterium]
MLEVVTKIFTRRDPRRDAVLGLARIISRYDMQRLGFEEGISPDRRDRVERHVAVGVWLFPCREDSLGEDLNTETVQSAVTHELRSEGFGVMAAEPFAASHCIIAIPDEEGGSWRFFRCSACHHTRRPGGWYYIGLHVERTVDLDGNQRIAFREHIASAENEHAAD